MLPQLGLCNIYSYNHHNRQKFFNGNVSLFSLLYFIDKEISRLEKGFSIFFWADNIVLNIMSLNKIFFVYNSKCLTVLLVSSRFSVWLHPNLRLLLLLSWCVLPALICLSLLGAARTALAGQKKAARAGVAQRLLLLSISEKRGCIVWPWLKLNYYFFLTSSFWSELELNFAVQRHGTSLLREGRIFVNGNDQQSQCLNRPSWKIWDPENR